MNGALNFFERLACGAVGTKHPSAAHSDHQIHPRNTVSHRAGHVGVPQPMVGGEALIAQTAKLDAWQVADKPYVVTVVTGRFLFGIAKANFIFRKPQPPWLAQIEDGLGLRSWAVDESTVCDGQQLGGSLGGDSLAI